jgi:hypothetical protein
MVPSGTGIFKPWLPSNLHEGFGSVVRFETRARRIISPAWKFPSKSTAVYLCRSGACIDVCRPS